MLIKSHPEAVMLLVSRVKIILSDEQVFHRVLMRPVGEGDDFEEIHRRIVAEIMDEERGNTVEDLGWSTQYEPGSISSETGR